MPSIHSAFNTESGSPKANFATSAGIDIPPAIANTISIEYDPVCEAFTMNALYPTSAAALSTANRTVSGLAENESPANINVTTATVRPHTTVYTGDALRFSPG